MLKILVSIPTLRPTQAAALMSKYMQLESGSNNVIYELVTEPVGKINAVNGFTIKDWDIVLIASDDMIPQVEKWDQIIIDDMKKFFPDTDGVLWYNDGYVGGRLNTLPCLGKKYYDRFGYIYHPAYKSLWADNEFMEVAEMLNKQRYMDNVIIKHEHPGNNPAVVYDDIYRRNDRHWNEDKAVYDQRKRQNFGL